MTQQEAEEVIRSLVQMSREQAASLRKITIGVGVCAFLLLLIFLVLIPAAK